MFQAQRSPEGQPASDIGSYVCFVASVDHKRDLTPKRCCSYGIFTHGLPADGKWLLYCSTKLGGTYNLFIQSYPSSNGESPIIVDGGCDPTWSLSGKEILYVNPDSGALMSVAVDMGVPPRVGTPKVIHPGYLLLSSIHSFAVLPGEQRFLINVREERTSPITVILNWPALLKR